MINRLLRIGMVFLALMGLSGCGKMFGTDDKKPSKSPALIADEAAFGGFTGCYNCHSDAANPAGLVKVFGDSAESKAAGTGWLSGPHGNPESFPSYAMLSDSCKACHDPLGDGTLIASYYSRTRIDGLGTSDRPVVACESCHGSGENHLGTSPVPYPKPDASRCGLCHSSALPSDHLVYHPEADSIYENWSASAHASNGADCKRCHDPHNPSRLSGTATTGASAQYATCTGCHDTSAGGSIYDTHFDDGLTNAVIEGYVLDPTSDRACSACHNVHEADNTIHEQWAHSAHGGYIADNVNAAGIGNITTAVAAAWANRDFKRSSSCIRCHTSTGFKNFAESPALYNSADVVYVNAALPNAFVAAGFQHEMLYCWGCHKNNAGGLRNPGVFNSVIAGYNTPSGRLEAISDLKGSNVCMACHSGRLSGQDIKDKWTNASIIGNTFDKFSPHYFIAGGILLRTIGYEYDVRDYSDSVYYVHNVIGTNGPCAACHMPSKGHEMESVTKSGGAITDIAAFDGVCSSCHRVSKSGLVSELNALESGFTNALDALKAELGNNGIYYSTSYPYFFNHATLRATANRFKAWPDKDTLGAAFNYALLHHEPGAYVHNAQYTRRLIYDSIDYIDGGGINNSVEATLLGAGATDAYNFLRGTRP